MCQDHHLNHSGERLIPALESPDAGVRVAAAFCLAQHPSITDTATIHVLRRALRDPSASVRRQAALALGGYANLARSAVLALTTALRDEDDLTRRFAAHALQQIDPDAAFRAGVE
jgi:HEAT repeat protein